MLITCIGHASFLLEMENGLRILFDPYDDSCGYPVLHTPADVVLASHRHHDHHAVETVPGTPRIIDRAGEYDLASGVKLTAIRAWHDDAQGALRGETLLFLLEGEGLRVAHLGDLGHLPGAEQVSALSPVDVLMIPVGGHYTIGAEDAARTAMLLEARVILPMHYRTKANQDWPITPVEDFTRLYAPDEAETLPLLRVCREDLSCQPKVAVLSPLSLKK